MCLSHRSNWEGGWGNPRPPSLWKRSVPALLLHATPHGALSTFPAHGRLGCLELQVPESLRPGCVPAPGGKASLADGPAWSPPPASAFWARAVAAAASPPMAPRAALAPVLPCLWVSPLLPAMRSPCSLAQKYREASRRVLSPESRCFAAQAPGSLR